MEAKDAEWSGNPAPTATWQWVRCPGTTADERSCRAIDGATRTTYSATAADLGKRLRVLLYLRNRDGWAWSLTAPSGAVAAAPKPEPEPEAEKKRKPEPKTRPFPIPGATMQPPPPEGAKG